MKILHTSDWHLGHHLYGHERTKEHAAMLEQMEKIVRDEQPDVFVLCGDVFHVAQPSASVQRMFVDHMIRIKRACPHMKVVVTAGNHDSATRHEAFSALWATFGVNSIGTLSDNADDHIISVDGKGFVVAVPYASDRNTPDGYNQRLLDCVAERNTDGLPVVMTAHTTVKGASYLGHEDVTDYTVGTIEGRDISAMGEGYDYLALGHIHRKQFVHTGKHNVRYCGSPMAVSFDEQYPHSVSIVEIEHHGDTPRVREIEIENPRPLVTLPVNEATDWDSALRLLAEFPDNQKAYIRLNVVIDDYLPVGAFEQAEAITRTKECIFCRINAVRRVREGEASSKTFTIQEVRELEPIDVVRKYAEQTNKVFDDEMEALFNEALAAVRDEARE